MTTYEAGRRRTAMVTAEGPRRRGFAIAGRWWVYLFLTLGQLITVVPFFWMLLGSLKTQSELVQEPPTWLPADPTFGNYSRMWSKLDFPRFFFNSAVSIVMPLSVPALAANAIITFLPAWNALLWPLVVLQSQDKYTLPVALAIFSRGQFQADYGLLMAGSVVLVVPVIVLFLLLQKRFTQSVAMTGIKG